mgnify:CR=1 FL=1
MTINLITLTRMSLVSIFVATASPTNAAERFLCEERWAQLVLLDSAESRFDGDEIVPDRTYVIDASGTQSLLGDVQISISGQ